MIHKRGVREDDTATASLHFLDTDAEEGIPAIMVREILLMTAAFNEVRQLDGEAPLTAASVFLRCSSLGLDALLAVYAKARVKNTTKAASFGFQRLL